MSEALDVLRMAVAHGLPGALPPSDTGAPPALSGEVISLAARHRVQGLLWTAITDGAITGTEQLIESASDATVNAMRTCLLSEQTAVQALSALTRAGVEARVLKGIAIAHLDHDDPAERVYGDADLLIRRSDYRAALTALIGAGFRRAKPPVRGWWEQRFAKAVVLYAPSGGELDLHMAITGGYFGEKIDHDMLWSTASEPFDLAGVEARGLDREGRLLQACCHCVLGGASGLRVRRDVAQLLLISKANWRATVAQARHCTYDLVVAEAIRTTFDDLCIPNDHESARWAASHAADPDQLRAIASYHSPTGGGWMSEGRGTLDALRPADRVRFLVGLAAPSRASLRQRGRTWGRHVRDGSRALARHR